MDSSTRCTQFSGRPSKNSDPAPVDCQQNVLSVAPLNSAPYIGPHTVHSNNSSMPTEVDTDAVERVGPAMIFMSSDSTRKEWDSVVAAAKSGVALTGSAAMGKVGSAIGQVDVGECEDSYLFRVSLPGVARDEKDFSCNVDPDGTIMIKGVTMTGEKIVCKNGEIFEMQTQNLCQPGRFTVSFQLPGAVDHEQFSGVLTNAILEGRVKKA